MNHADHVALIRDGVPAPGGTWADFGSGQGAFALALAELLGPEAQIWSVDRDARALADQEMAMLARFPATTLHTLTGDFTRGLAIPTLDGAVLANALHFLSDAGKDTALGLIRRYLRPGGKLIVVEYNIAHGNRWVPYPFTFAAWGMIARRNGFTEPRMIARRPSRTFSEIYAAVSERPNAAK